MFIGHQSWCLATKPRLKHHAITLRSACHSLRSRCHRGFCRFPPRFRQGKTELCLTSHERNTYNAHVDALPKKKLDNNNNLSTSHIEYDTSQHFVGCAPIYLCKSGQVQLNINNDHDDEHIVQQAPINPFPHIDLTIL